MSDYERINAKVKANVACRRNKAIKRIVLVLAKVVLFLAAVLGLKAIGFISGSFLVILMCVAIVVGAFKVGFISCEIKF